MILVIGAADPVGSKVMRALAVNGLRVRALAHNPHMVKGMENTNIEIVEGDLREPETLGQALEGVEKVFLSTRADPQQVELQKEVIDAAKSAEVSHIVRLSAFHCHLGSPVPFLRWHAEAEMELEASGIPFTHLRPNYFMQNTLAFRSSITHERAIHAPMGNGKTSMVDIWDVVSIAVAVLTKEGHSFKAYDITGPEALSFSDVAKYLSKVIRKKVVYVDVPLQHARKGMLDAGMPQWRVEGLTKLYELLGAGYASTVTNAVGHVTQNEPRTFRQFARVYAQEFKYGKHEPMLVA